MKRRGPETTRFEHHALFGEIRLIRRTGKGPAGRATEWWEYDPSFQPPVPTGAIRGNPSKQVYCALHHVPKYFYIDERRQCVQCGNPFFFSAKEQRYWYETLKFNFHSVPIRCSSCRRRQRSEAALRSEIAVARAALRRSPGDPGALLALAQALVRYHQATERGSLEDALAASRRARSLWPDAPESWFWEGLAHRLAQRDGKARDCLARFLALPAARRRALRPLVAEARRVLDERGAA